MFLALTKWHFHKYKTYRKIPKISPQGLYFSKALFEGLSFEGAYNVQREICVSKLFGLACCGKKFAIFALFYFVLEGKFQVQVPGGGGGYIRWGDVTDGFLRYDLGGLIIGGAYFWNFTVCKLIFKWLTLCSCFKQLISTSKIQKQQR